jgi:mRNA-degrading endonuclease toxin of MazEF toxin-antitoxin module
MVIDKNRLLEKIGTLSPRRTREIVESVGWVMGLSWTLP